MRTLIDIDLWKGGEYSELNKTSSNMWFIIFKILPVTWITYSTANWLREYLILRWSIKTDCAAANPQHSVTVQMHVKTSNDKQEPTGCKLSHLQRLAESLAHTVHSGMSWVFYLPSHRPLECKVLSACSSFIFHVIDRLLNFGPFGWALDT